MKPSFASAIALAAATLAGPASAQYSTTAEAGSPRAATNAQAQGPTLVKVSPSRQAQSAIAELQKAVLAKDSASIPGKVAAAQAVATTKEDRYLIAQLQLKAAVASNDNEAAAAAMDVIAATGLIDSAKLSDIFTSLGSSFYNEKKYDRAATEYEHAIALAPANTEPLTLLAEARFAHGRAADGAIALSKVLQMELAAGVKPDEKLYRRAVSMAYQAELPSAVQLSRDWLNAYPSASSWKNAIAIYRNTSDPSAAGLVDLLRLLRTTGSLSDPLDYKLYAKFVTDQNNFGEAQSLIDQGVAAKLVDPASPDFQDVMATLKAKPVPTQADLFAAAKSAPAGSTLIGIGDRMYGIGQYAQAAEIYRQALARGADKDLANLHLGMALARAGDKAGATAALNAAGGVQAGIARYWLIYVQKMA